MRTLERRKSVSFNLENNQSFDEETTNTNSTFKSILKTNGKTWDNSSLSSSISSLSNMPHNMDMATLEEHMKAICNHCISGQQWKSEPPPAPKDKIRNYYKTILGLGSFKEARKLKKQGFTSSLINAVADNKNKYVCHANITTSGFTMYPYESILMGRLSTTKSFNSSLICANISEKRTPRTFIRNITVSNIRALS